MKLIPTVAGRYSFFLVSTVSFLTCPDPVTAEMLCPAALQRIAAFFF